MLRSAVGTVAENEAGRHGVRIGKAATWAADSRGPPAQFRIWGPALQARRSGGWPALQLVEGLGQLVQRAAQGPHGVRTPQVGCHGVLGWSRADGLAGGRGSFRVGSQSDLQPSKPAEGNLRAVPAERRVAFQGRGPMDPCGSLRDCAWRLGLLRAILAEQRDSTLGVECPLCVSPQRRHFCPTLEP